MHGVDKPANFLQFYMPFPCTCWFNELPVTTSVQALPATLITVFYPRGLLVMRCRNRTLDSKIEFVQITTWPFISCVPAAILALTTSFSVLAAIVSCGSLFVSIMVAQVLIWRRYAVPTDGWRVVVPLGIRAALLVGLSAGAILCLSEGLCMYVLGVNYLINM